MEERNDDALDSADANDIDDDLDAPELPVGLGVIGQLAAAVVVVAVLVVLFMGGSAVLRRLFG